MTQVSIERRYSPFSNGSQFMDWEEKNCGNCHKNGACEIQHEIYQAHMDDGYVSMPIALRMGTFRGDMRYGWRCSELVMVQPLEVYAKRIQGPPTKLMPLHRRIAAAFRFALEIWTPRWSPDYCTEEPMSCIPLHLAWSVAWGIERDRRILAKK